MTSLLLMTRLLGAIMAVESKLSGYQKSRFAEGKDRLADGVHEPVLYLLPKQNRELPYASERQGKPADESKCWSGYIR